MKIAIGYMPSLPHIDCETHAFFSLLTPKIEKWGILIVRKLRHFTREEGTNAY